MQDAKLYFASLLYAQGSLLKKSREGKQEKHSIALSLLPNASKEREEREKERYEICADRR